MRLRQFRQRCNAPFRSDGQIHGLLMDRAYALVGCVEGSPEEAELAALTGVIEAYERQRWPSGKIAGRQMLIRRSQSSDWSAIPRTTRLR